MHSSYGRYGQRLGVDCTPPVVDRAPAIGAPRTRESSCVIVLCYHAVSPSWPCSLAVTPAQLRWQLSLLLRRGWTGATFSQAVLERRARRTFAVTFDDAFASVIELALPIMSELGVPGTIFAPTSFMNDRQSLSWPGIAHWHDTAYAAELTSMDWNDLRSLAAHGWEIGSHTRTHPHLTQLDDDRLADELYASRAACIARLDGECTSVAYPYGDVDTRVAAIAREAGYRVGGVLGRSLQRCDRYFEPRIGIYDVDKAWRYRLKLAAPSRWLRAAR